MKIINTVQEHLQVGMVITAPLKIPGKLTSSQVDINININRSESDLRSCEASTGAGQLRVQFIPVI